MRFYAPRELNANFSTFTLDLNFYNNFLVSTKEISLDIQYVNPKIICPVI